MTISTSNNFPEVKILTPNVVYDHRGFFMESFNMVTKKNLGVEFHQDNHSRSLKNVFRGIHYQWEEPMGKLCRVIRGSGYDLVVDLRIKSPTFGKYEFIYLSENNFSQVWVPAGFGHGFLSLDDRTDFVYKCSSVFNSSGEGSINPFDVDLDIDWPIEKNMIILSDKDKNAKSFNEYKNNPKF